MKTINIIIAPNGHSRIETSGFTGTDCQQASRFLESALGKRTQESLKPEFHQTATGTSAHTNHQHG